MLICIKNVAHETQSSVLAKYDNEQSSLSVGAVCIYVPDFKGTEKKNGINRRKTILTLLVSEEESGLCCTVILNSSSFPQQKTNMPINRSCKLVLHPRKNAMVIAHRYCTEGLQLMVKWNGITVLLGRQCHTNNSVCATKSTRKPFGVLSMFTTLSYCLNGLIKSTYKHTVPVFIFFLMYLNNRILLRRPHRCIRLPRDGYWWDHWPRVRWPSCGLRRRRC